MKEPILEPILRKMRLSKVLPTISSYRDCALLDIGCGWEAKLLRSVEPHISKGVGIDFKAPQISSANGGGRSTLSPSHWSGSSLLRMRALTWSL